MCSDEQAGALLVELWEAQVIQAGVAQAHVHNLANKDYEFRV